MLEPLRDFQSSLLAAIHGIPEKDLRKPESPTRWSILEVIAHLSDLELVCSVRMRTILATDRPDLQKLDGEAWVSRVHAHDTRDEILEQLWFFRRLNLSLLERLDATQRARIGIHPEYGEMSIEQIARFIVTHQTKHLGQIEKTKITHRLTASTERWLDGGYYPEG